MCTFRVGEWAESKLCNIRLILYPTCSHFPLSFRMMENLLIEENEFLRIERTSLPVASYCKFQPLTVDFLDITDPKAVLERALRNFSCLTSGDLIAIRYNDRRYELIILETKPADAVSIVECDMSVEFAAPVGYKADNVACKEDEPMETSVEESGIREEKSRFPGGGARMDGKRVEGNESVGARGRREDPDFSFQISSLRFSRTWPASRQQLTPRE